MELFFSLWSHRNLDALARALGQESIYVAAAMAAVESMKYLVSIFSIQYQLDLVPVYLCICHIVFHVQCNACGISQLQVVDGAILVGCVTTLDRVLDWGSKGLEFDSQNYSCVVVLGKLLNPDCSCLPKGA